ncbi:hypothetical protein GCK72_013765 [Caenorhabditis remanei]|uniref:CUB-like domain-containing protein n=1 Tax=Caenorhabditis remanei TaxID=31234 RepID=A0A6A5GPL0_CAERE|nr:hypothetical protein GCK72_013765 [Caenorhabditis remanei]KAF1757310.1 hypothetical protein GCK72_013765 [Caenorhabditis remanei]
MQHAGSTDATTVQHSCNTCAPLTQQASGPRMTAAEPVELPANFRCTYTIKAPLNSTNGIYAYVELRNGIRGVNDYITVIDTTGFKYRFNNRSERFYQFFVIPGREMSVDVITKTKFGSTKSMETENKMNFVNLADLRSNYWYDKGFSSSVTYIGEEPIYLTLASPADIPYEYLCSCFLIDGNIYNQTNVRRLADFLYYETFTSTTNSITILSFWTEYGDDYGVVLNPLSESLQFASLVSMGSSTDDPNTIYLNQRNEKEAVEIIDFYTEEITMTSLKIDSLPGECSAYAVTGPPNNSSTIILDLTTSEHLIPYTFKMKYFSVIYQNCTLSFTIRSPFVPLKV